MPINFKHLRQIQVPDCESIFDLAFHYEKDRVFAVSTIEGHIHMYDGNRDSNQPILTLEKHHKGTPVRKVTFADEKMLVSAAKSVKLFDLDTGQTIRKIDNNGVKIYSLLVVDHYLLCTGDDEGYFKLWDYRTDRGVAMELKECEDYISDFDVDSDGRIVLATSGEGTLSAFNIRAKRLEPPQSELFDAGFQSVRYLEAMKKAVVGAEDGALNIFNVNEWGNISDRFPLKGTSGRKEGSCSVDCIENVHDSVILVGCSDGLLRAVNILPNQVLQNVEQHNYAVESLAVQDSSRTYASVDTNIIKLGEFNIEESEDEDSSADSDGSDSDSDHKGSKKRRKKQKQGKQSKPTADPNNFFSDLA